MIVTENFKVGERDFIRTYSNSRRYVDPAEFGRTYTEGDLLPSEERESEIQAKAEAYDILMGGAE